MMLNLISVISATIVVCIVSLISVFKAVKYIRRPTRCDKLIAFFHPYCDSGGGGERVLWFMVYALLNDPNRKERIHIVIYSGDKKSKQQIIDNVKTKFNIILSRENADDITIVDIQSRFLLEAKYYPVATMIGQSLGSVVVGLECLLYVCPDVYVDTIGAAFTYPLARLLAGATVIAYVHYPIISSDMLNKVRERRPSFNNNARISSSVTVSKMKLIYYQLFAQLYSFVGSFASTAMVNSSWTHKHIAELWNFPYEKLSPKRASNNKKNKNKLLLVYPPCNTSTLESIPLDRDSHDKTHKKRVIVSIGQFRPEKHHVLQIKALAKLIESDPVKYDDVLLVMIGSTRNKEDALLQKALVREAADLGVYENVRFEVNQPYGVLVKYMAESLIGLHSMWNEHFGISIVEMMAAGLIVIAHNSGGPVMDIVISATAATDDTVAAKELTLIKNTTGFVAKTVEQYAQCMATILDGYDQSRQVYDNLRKRARLSTLRFSDEEFMRQCVHAIKND